MFVTAPSYNLNGVVYYTFDLAMRAKYNGLKQPIRAVEATAEGKSIFAYDKGGKVAAAYEQFSKEVAELGEKQRNQNRADRLR